MVAAAASVLLDFRRFCSLLTISTKEADAEPIPFDRWWPEQEDFERNRLGRDLVLKTRQIGFTTLELARDLQYAVTHQGVQVVLVGHDSDELARIFETCRTWAHALAECRRGCGDGCKARDHGLLFAPTLDDTGRLYWEETRSFLRVRLAGETERVARKVGRGGGIHRLHCTEVAFWGAPDAALTALLKAVPKGGEVVIESTANGIGNRFHHDVTRSIAGELPGYRLHFWPWYFHDEYRLPVEAGFDAAPRDDWERKLRDEGCDDEQVAWWRQEIVALGGGQHGLEMALQENPISIGTAFRATGGRYVSAAACDRLDALTCQPIDRVVLGTRDALEDDGAGHRTLGTVDIFERPLPGQAYLITADVADGGGCLSTAKVFDVCDLREVAAFASETIEAGDHGLLLVALARLYNDALLGPERNNTGAATLQAIVGQARYQRVWIAEDGKLGWITTPITRPVMVDALRRAIEDGHVSTPDAATVTEVRGLIHGDGGRPGKGPGSTDDRWMAWAIALQLHQRGAATQGLAYVRLRQEKADAWGSSRKRGAWD